MALFFNNTTGYSDAIYSSNLIWEYCNSCFRKTELVKIMTFLTRFKRVLTLPRDDATLFILVQSLENYTLKSKEIIKSYFWSTLNLFMGEIHIFII